jgi:hypothetical protein
MPTKTEIHPNINAIRDHSIGSSEHKIRNVDELVKTVFCSRLAEWREKLPHSRHKGQLVLRCPVHWTLEDVQCALYLSHSSYLGGFANGKYDIQSQFANLLNLKSEED